MSRTFLMVKPSAVAAGHTGPIIDALEKGGFRVVGMLMKQLTREEAARFYDVHVGKGFFETLMEYVTSGPTVGVTLDTEGEDAVASLRAFIGATDPAKAEEGTIRARFGKSLTANAVHASDSAERVEYESGIYFGECPRAAVG